MCGWHAAEWPNGELLQCIITEGTSVSETGSYPGLFYINGKTQGCRVVAGEGIRVEVFV